MYHKDVIKNCVVINRNKLVDIIFDIGLDYDNGYDTCINAVTIADKYVNITNNPYTIELAHVVCVISNKINEDHGYRSIEYAARQTENGYVRSLEWDVCLSLNFDLIHKNFITYIGYTLDPTMIYCTPPLLGPIFWDISKIICNEKLNGIHPKTILLAVLLLNKYNKRPLFVKNYKERLFMSILSTVSNEYDIPLNKIISKYIHLNAATQHQLT